MSFDITKIFHCIRLQMKNLKKQKPRLYSIVMGCIKCIVMMANELWKYHFPPLILFSSHCTSLLLICPLPIVAKGIIIKDRNRKDPCQSAFFSSQRTEECYIFDFEITSHNEFYQRTGKKNCVLFLARILSMPFNDSCGTGSKHAAYLSILSMNKHKQTLLYSGLKLTR